MEPNGPDVREARGASRALTDTSTSAGVPALEREQHRRLPARDGNLRFAVHFYNHLR
jgi:hypothetical protein